MMSIRGLRWRAATAISLAISGGVLAGCSAAKEPELPRSKYYSDILQAAKTTDSDFQRVMLEDGVVTRAEYEEAMTATGNCMSKRGYELGKTLQDGIYILSIVASDAAEKALDQCTAQYSGEVAGFFQGQVSNPERRDFIEDLVSCLIHSKVAPPSYTPREYLVDMDRGFKDSPLKIGSPAEKECTAKHFPEKPKN
ncbi:MAG: hypothetical protein ACRC0L_01420 [Angustibacter sp.]